MQRLYQARYTFCVKHFQIPKDKQPLSCTEVNKIVQSAAEVAIQENIEPLRDQLEAFMERVDDLIEEDKGENHSQLWQNKVFVKLKRISKRMYCTIHL